MLLKAIINKSFKIKSDLNLTISLLIINNNLENIKVNFKHQEKNSISIKNLESQLVSKILQSSLLSLRSKNSLYSRKKCWKMKSEKPF